MDFSETTMNNSDILQFAQEAGFEVTHQGVIAGSVHGADIITEELARFAQLVAAVERDACAEICYDEVRIRTKAGESHPEDSASRDRCFAAARAAINCAAEIRARHSSLRADGVMQSIEQLKDTSATLAVLLEDIYEIAPEAVKARICKELGKINQCIRDVEHKI